MTNSRRLAPLPLLLIGLAALAVLVFIPWVVHAQTTNQSATGRPVVLASAQGAGLLFADTEGIADGNGLPIDSSSGSWITFDYSYQWVRVDGDSEMNVGADSDTYQPVEADVGKLIKVEVSFRDGDNFPEAVTSLPFGPIAEPPPSGPLITLVSNTGQSPSSTANITQQYAVGFRLGNHGQGYDISSVSIELAAVPSDLTVSLWSGSVGFEGIHGANSASKLFDFANPSSFAVGLNEFTAPAGAFAYQNVNYFIVLSGFGATLSINETTSDFEDAGGEPGAVIYDKAAVRASSATGVWAITTSRGGVLRLAVEGSRRARGIVASNYAQSPGDVVDQEVISVGDAIGFGIELGAADRYLIRGVSLVMDDSTAFGSGFTNPFVLRSGSLTGARQFSLTNTRDAPGLPVWTAQRGATVAGGTEYVFDQPVTADSGTNPRRDSVLSRVQGAESDGVDRPSAPRVSFTGAKGGDIQVDNPYMAVHGDPLYAMVQNLGQADDGYRTVGSTSVKALTQGFTTGPDTDGYELLGIGVNIEGSNSKFPDGPTSVSVAVHADSGGQPGAKLFDLLSPDEYAAGHSFFEAPRGTMLEASTSYVMVWSHLGGTEHRLRKTGSNSEDSGARPGFSMANAFYQGADLDNLAMDTGSDVLEMAVYTAAPPPGNAAGRPVVLAAAQGAGILFADTEGIADEEGLPIDSSSGSWITFDYSYQWIRVDGDSEMNVGADSDTYQPVEADVGKLIKVEVSFRDGDNFPEAVTSLPFGPIAEPPPSGPLITLVSNTGQSPSSTANITQQYAVGFRLGNHGQGYDISSVSIELAAVPSDLTVSLWSGSVGFEGIHGANSASKLFDFANPSSFAVGLNEFTAPAGAFAYQNVNYFIVLSGFGATLSINETTSDFEDAGGEPGAVIYDKAAVRASSATGVWAITTSRGGVLRLAVEGSERARGIVASNYAQSPGDVVDQEVISVGDAIGFGIELGAADRYLIRGVSLVMDDSTAFGSGFTNPFVLRSGSLTGARQFSLTNTRDAPGLPVWTAQRGATVAGGTEYVFDQPVTADSGTNPRRDSVLSRVQGAESDGVDRPSAPGVSFTGAKGGDIQVDNSYMAVHGDPLYAMVQNLGQADDSYRTVGSSSVKALTQGFTTGPDTDGYELLGIGVNIEGSNSKFPDGSASVSVAVHADSGGQPGAKLFDLLSPDEYAAGHSFFEAPRGTMLEASTSYVMVWSHLGGTEHRLQKTGSNNEDSGARPGFSMANAFYQGADLDNLAVDTGSDVLEMAVYTAAPLPGNATGRPVVLAAAQGAGILFADAEGIADEEGLPIDSTNTYVTFEWSYQWVRVDGNFETNVGADSATYQPVEADVGKLIKVEVSFTDGSSFPETVTSLPFGPIAELAGPSAPPSTLVSNTGQSPSSTANITQRYAVGFRLGDHGQGYEISSVSIELAAVPSDLTVSLWSGGVEGGTSPNFAIKLFDFANPSSFAVGLNEFTAPAGAFAYQNVNYYIVLSNFGSSLSIKETTSDDEDAGGEPGAVIYDSAAVRALSDTGRWVISGDRGGVLRLAVEGSMRARGIVASNYAQPIKDPYDQEIISVGDDIGWGIELGAADRYLIRGVSFNQDATTTTGSGFTNPFVLRLGSRTGAVQFSLVNTRAAPGLPVWTAPQGATVAGGCTTVMSVETCKEYVFDQPITADDGDNPRRDSILSRIAGADSDGVDSPAAAGVSFTGGKGDNVLDDPLMALLGEPLDAMVQNLGQTDNSYFTVGDTYTVVSQGFTTGSDGFGYRLQGIGVNIEGSDDSNGNAQVPSGPTSVSVAVHADSSGKPGAKLFDLVSPTEYAPGHSFFEAPLGTNLAPNTSYVLVWSYNRGTWHRLQRTSSNSEDSGARNGASIANGLNRGADLSNLIGGTNKLEIAVYTEVPTRAPFVAGGIEVPLSWLHIPDGAYAGYQFRALYVTHRGRLPTSGDIEEYNTWVQWEAKQAYSDPIVRSRRVSEDIKAVVCTVDDDARTNTGMTGIGVPVHWLDGGWDDRPTLVANSNAEFYGPKWVNTDYGAYVTGNSAHFEDYAMVWTGCDASGVAHPDFPMGATAMDMVAVGTPRGRSLKTREEAADSNFAPLGAVDVASGYAYRHFIVVIDEGEIDEEELEILLPLFAISPIFTVAAPASPRTLWSTTMMVGASSSTAGTVTTDNAGYSSTDGDGSIGSSQITIDLDPSIPGATTYSLAALRTVKETEGSTVTSDELVLELSPGLLPAVLPSVFALELDGVRFPLSAATRIDGNYVWADHGLTWSENDSVEVKLIDHL